MELSNAIESVSSSAYTARIAEETKAMAKVSKNNRKKRLGTNLEEVASGRPILHAGEVMKLNRRGKFHVKTFVLFKNSLCYVPGPRLLVLEIAKDIYWNPCKLQG